MCCFEISTCLGVKNISGHTHKTESWYLLEVHFKISDEHPPSLIYWSRPPASLPLTPLISALGSDDYVGEEGREGYNASKCCLSGTQCGRAEGRP